MISITLCPICSMWNEFHLICMYDLCFSYPYCILQRVVLLFHSPAEGAVLQLKEFGVGPLCIYFVFQLEIRILNSSSYLLSVNTQILRKSLSSNSSMLTCNTELFLREIPSTAWTCCSVLLNYWLEGRKNNSLSLRRSHVQLEHATQSCVFKRS